MHKFTVGDRVRILAGAAIPFVGGEGIIDAVRPNDRGIETMDRYVVMFERREKRTFFTTELLHVQKTK